MAWTDDEIVQAVTGGPVPAADPVIEDDDEEPEPPPLATEALKAVDVVLRFLESRENIDPISHQRAACSEYHQTEAKRGDDAEKTDRLLQEVSSLQLNQTVLLRTNPNPNSSFQSPTY